MTYRLSLFLSYLLIAGCGLTGGGGGGGGGSAQAVTEERKDLPDLYIDSINWRISGGNIHVVARVKNLTPVNSPAGYTVSASNLSGITRTCVSSNVLLPGNSYYSELFLFPIGAGITSDTITARVDSLGVIAETNERNNETIEHCTFPARIVAIN